MRRFLQSLLLRRPGQLVLKSPQHTFRVAVLLRMFPGARFVHLVRDPFVVFPSTVHFWKVMYATYAFQNPRFDRLERQVFDTFRRMYERLEAARPLLDSRRLFEMRYEELVANPVGQMRALYAHFELGDFSVVEPAVEAYAARSKKYRTNTYDVSEETRQQIAQQWSGYIAQYGYGRDKQPVVSGPDSPHSA